MDVVTAYLAGELHKEDEEIYIEVLEGLEIREEDEGRVYRILKSLYGLKQSARL